MYNIKNIKLIFLKKILKLFLRFIELKFRYKISFTKLKKKNFNGKLNLNIGTGRYEINGFKSLDIYTPHYYKSKQEFLKKRVEYNIRKDSIPFKNNTVDNIYCSHVLEHIENEYVIKFLKESYRVLKKKGVLRVACPDSEFLFNVSLFENEYWNWRHPTFINKNRFETNWDEICQYDFLIKETAAPRMRFYKNKIISKVFEIDDIKKLKYHDFCESIKKDLTFRENHPGDHINNWDFSRLKEIGEIIGFNQILKSKYLGSVSIDMQSNEFDKTHPQMTLYVEFIK